MTQRPQAIIQKPEAMAFTRLNALLKKGYRIQLRQEPDILQLEHPGGPETGAPDLILCADGLILASGYIRPHHVGDGDEGAVGIDDLGEREFQSFLTGIPQPTFWQGIGSSTLSEAKFRVEMWLIYTAITAAVVLPLLLLFRWLRGDT